ncbi:Triacylglycerol lipase 2 [Linum perenne]
MTNHIYKVTGQKMHYVGHSMVSFCLNCKIVTLSGNNCCLDSSTIALFLKHEPQSTSTKNLIHFSQTVRDGVLTKFNYDTVDKNLKHYRAASPPIYNLSNIPHSFPIFLSYGSKDALSDTTDVIHLLDHFKFHDKNKMSIQIVKKYAHVDFIMGLDAKDIVYKQVVSFFKHWE